MEERLSRCTYAKYSDINTYISQLLIHFSDWDIFMSFRPQVHMRSEGHLLFINHMKQPAGPSNYIRDPGKEEITMAFFNSAVTVLQTLVVALGAGLGIWGAINLLEGYGNDNPGAKSQGMKQLMAGGGVALIGITLVPLLSGLFG